MSSKGRKKARNMTAPLTTGQSWLLRSLETWATHAEEIVEITTRRVCNKDWDFCIKYRRTQSDRWKKLFIRCPEVNVKADIQVTGNGDPIYILPPNSTRTVFELLPRLMRGSVYTRNQFFVLYNRVLSRGNRRYLSDNIVFTSPYEPFVEKGLDILLEGDSILQGYAHFTPFSHEDEKGVDFAVYVDTDKYPWYAPEGVLNLQVKSGRYDSVVTAFVVAHKGENISLILAYPTFTPQDYAYIILNLLEHTPRKMHYHAQVTSYVRANFYTTLRTLIDLYLEGVIDSYTYGNDIFVITVAQREFTYALSKHKMCDRTIRAKINWLLNST